MIIDVHTHIFPPEVISGRERFFAKEPEFELLYGHPGAKMASARDLIKSMDECGIDYSVVFGFPWRSEDYMARHNDYIIESAARHSDRLIPLACLDLFSESCLRNAQILLRAGVAGFGELAIYSASKNLPFALQNFGLIAELCREQGAVLLAHANEPVGHHYPGKAPYGLDLYYTMAKAAAGTRLILAHWGGGVLFYELLKKDSAEIFADVYYDTAASPFVYRKEIYAAAAKIIGENKILFGSDYPLISPRRYFDEIAQSGLSATAMSSIRGDNAARLFSLKN